MREKCLRRSHLILLLELLEAKKNARRIRIPLVVGILLEVDGQYYTVRQLLCVVQYGVISTGKHEEIPFNVPYVRQSVVFTASGCLQMPCSTRPCSTAYCATFPLSLARRLLPGTCFSKPLNQRRGIVVCTAHQVASTRAPKTGRRSTI